MAFASEPLSLDGFADAIHHWRNRHDQTDYPRYEPTQVAAIADNILLWQRANGGWTENEDPARILNETELKAVAETKDATDTSFDNRNVWPQITYLAGAYTLTDDERYREGSLQGLEFVLGAQHPSGGWPHSFPDGEGYRRHLTFADDIIPDQLRLLRRVANGDGPFDWMPETIRARAAGAVKRGDACILKLQIRIDEEATIWAGQYAANTLLPAKARSYELPALVSRESVAVVRYLMSIPDPSPDVVAAIEGAIAWYENNQITGQRFERFEIEPERYEYHTARFDRRLVEDADAPPLWSRFSDLTTSEPFLANRDGLRVQHLADVERERRTGYDWYGTWPQSLLDTHYPAWKATQPHRE